MTSKFTKELSKQKLAIIVVVLFISSVWASVLYLEYRISQSDKRPSYLEIEKGLCLSLPIGCHALKAKGHYALYCQSGSAGKIYLDATTQRDTPPNGEFSLTELKGKSKLYLIEIKINNGESKKLGQITSCSD